MTKLCLKWDDLRSLYLWRLLIVSSFLIVQPGAPAGADEFSLKKFQGPDAKPAIEVQVPEAKPAGTRPAEPGCPTGWQRSPVLSAWTWIPNDVSVFSQDYRGIIVDMAPNPLPPTNYPSHQEVVNSKEYRGLTLIQLRACLEAGSLKALELDYFQSAGYTPLSPRTAIGHIPDVIRVPACFVTPGLDWVLDEACKAKTYDPGEFHPSIAAKNVKTAIDPGRGGNSEKITVSVWNGFRIGKTGQVVSGVLKSILPEGQTNLNVPFAWHTLLVEVEAGSLKGTVTLGGSGFPNHFMHVDRSVSRLVRTKDDKAIRDFLNAGNGQEAPSGSREEGGAANLTKTFKWRGADKAEDLITSVKDAKTLNIPLDNPQ